MANLGLLGLFLCYGLWGGWYRQCGLLVASFFFFLVELATAMIVIMGVGQWVVWVPIRLWWAISVDRLVLWDFFFFFFGCWFFSPSFLVVSWWLGWV